MKESNPRQLLLIQFLLRASAVRICLLITLRLRATPCCSPCLGASMVRIHSQLRAILAYPFLFGDFAFEQEWSDSVNFRGILLLLAAMKSPHAIQ